METDPNKIFDVIIVGAGLSGLCLARKVSSAKPDTIVFEKSRSVGGRIATRRDGQATYDHGAQFLKVSNDRPNEIAPFLASQSSLITWFEKDGSKYLVAPRGMTSIAKEMSQNLNIRFNEKVLFVSENSEGLIHVHCESQLISTARNLFLSAPLPQSLEILKTSNISYPPALESISYAKALVGLFELETSNSLILSTKYVQLDGSDILSIANQHSKGISEKCAWTIIMSPSWSEEHFEKSEEDIISKIQDSFTSFLLKKSNQFKINNRQLKKWRFSHPESIYSAAFESVGTYKNIFIIGDAFGGASLRGAMNSASTAFDQFKLNQ